MKSKDEIVHNISDNIKRSIDEDWTSALLEINVSSNFSSYKGYYFFGDVRKPIKVSRFDLSIDDDLIELHSITTTILNEIDKWNVALFTLSNNGSFDLKYIWDQQLYESVYSDN